jgi:hypothetical protein
MENKMLNWLRQHIKETSSADLKKEWQEVEKLFPEGPNAFEYINTIEQNNNFGIICHPPPQSSKTEFTFKLASESFEANFFV